MATPGTWQTLSYGGMQYQFLLPDNYNPAFQYPVLLFLHGGGEENLLPGMIDPWFNTAAFRSAYPAIVVAPQLPNSSATVTWGAYPADGSISAPGPNSAGENQALAILQNVLANYAADPNRVYVTGLSLGGHGTWDMMIKYNAYDGPDGRIFAAGLSLSGAIGNGVSSPGNDIVSELQNVPLWAIHGIDGAQPWDLGMQEEAPGSAFHLTFNPGLGHDVWDTYYPLPNGQPFYDWMFSQSAVSGQSYSISAPSLTTSENAGSLTFTVTRTDLRQVEVVYVSTVADQGSANAGAYNELTAMPIGFTTDQPSTPVTLTINDLGLSAGSGTYRCVVSLTPDVSTAIATTDFTIVNTDPAPACFVHGTQILTETGNVPVERLRLGDRVLSALGRGSRRVTWIGHRRIDCTRHPDPRKVSPIAIAPHTFGPGLPERTLFLSPDHAVLLNGALIPSRCLVNGTTIRQVKLRSVTYYHVELPTHDVIFAEGLPAESYLEVNDRADFADCPVATLHPDFASRIWEARGCAPLLITGPAVEAARSSTSANAPRTASGRT